MATAEEIKVELERVAQEAQAFRKQVHEMLDWFDGESMHIDDQAEQDACYYLGEIHGYAQAMQAVLFPDEEE